MTRAVLSAAIDSEWSVVSESKPCPICGSGAGCSIHTDADFACCAREPSDWPLTNGAWLHRVHQALSMPSTPATLFSAGVEVPESETRLRL